MIEVQTLKCPSCGRNFDISTYVGEEIIGNGVKITKKITQKTSWDELNTEIRNGRANLILDVGDLLDVELKNGTKISVEVAALNPYGDNVAFSFANVLQEAQMNRTNTNRGGWASSEMAKFLEKEILPLLPDDLVELITPRKIIQKQGERIFEHTSKLWLPSYTEVFGYDECYSQCDVGDVRFPLFANRRGRVRYTLDDKLTYQWLRSPYVNNTTTFWNVYYNGNGHGNYASITYGVCPCFIIGKLPDSESGEQ